MLTRRLLSTIGAVAMPLVFAGCQSNDDAAQKEVDNLRKKIEHDIQHYNDPKSQVVQMRKYAAETLDDITDAEQEFIDANEPEIVSNFDNTMYAYLWKFDKHHIIEVLTSSAPYEPIAVYRVSKVYFP